MFTLEQNEQLSILLLSFSRGTNCARGWCQTFSLCDSECRVTPVIKPQEPVFYSGSQMNRKQRRMLIMGHVLLSPGSHIKVTNHRVYTNHLYLYYAFNFLYGCAGCHLIPEYFPSLNPEMISILMLQMGPR